MKIITWNINKAAYARKNLWKYLRKLDFDVGLFQEVYMIPNELRNYFYVVRGEMNAILIKKNADIIKEEDVLNINSKNPVIKDFFISCEVEFSGKRLILISVYNYMGPNEKDFREFLGIVYEYIKTSKDKIVIVGGDFNMSDKFQRRLVGWGNLAKEMIKKFSDLKYEDVLHKLYKESEQDRFTYIATNKKSSYQLDYLFLPKQIKIISAKTGDENEIFNQQSRLSDHLPIIAEIEI